MGKYIINTLIDHLPESELKFRVTPHIPQLPSTVDLRGKFPPCYDQGQLGSCSANAFVGAYEYLEPGFMGSRLFLYYNERKLENDIPDDAGAQLSDGVKSLEKNGLCPETEWPYDITKFADQPPETCYTDAEIHRAVEVHNVPNDLTTMKKFLAGGYPIVIGILLFPEFEGVQVANTGVVPMPDGTSQPIGGHAVVLCGFRDDKQWWIVRNSWGNNWGDKGYFYLPYDYLLDPSLCSDMWVISKVTK